MRNDTKACLKVATYNLDELVACCTAFTSFKEFERAADAGYVPTLLVKTVANGPYRATLWQVCVNTLASALTARGFRVWTGNPQLDAR